MKQIFILLAGALLYSATAPGQQYGARLAKATFIVAAPAKEIKGASDSVMLSTDFRKGAFRLRMPLRTFGFSNNFVADSLNAMIGQRFRSYYMEEPQYPFVTYEGKITNITTIKLHRNGRYPIQASGTLTLHGISQPVSASGYITVSGKSVALDAQLTVIPSAFKIRIPPYIGTMYFREVNVQLHADMVPQQSTRQQ